MSPATDIDGTEDLVEFVEKMDYEERLAKEEMPFDTSKCSMKRLNQAIYSCLTCFKEDGKLKGVCYACSISCHTSHQLVDLGFRRSFQCDCSSGCRLVASSALAERDEMSLEIGNVYEKIGNFHSKFCYCKQLHDPEEEERVMIQCLKCLDWYHDSCINNGIPENRIPKEEDFDDYLCLDCLSDQSFADLLGGYIQTQFTQAIDSSLSCCQRPNAKKRKVEESDDSVGSIRGTFLPIGWRSHICRCSICLEMMKEKGIEWLLEKETPYTPPLDPCLQQSSTDAAMQVLARMDRIVALNGISKFHSFKSALSDYLSSFAREGRIVQSQDITTFFDSLVSAQSNFP